MKRIAIFAYGIINYVVFLATFLYSIGFVGNLLVPKSIDSPPEGPLGPALLIDAALLGVFAVQHSVMARAGFKRWWTRIIPKAAERSTYVLFSNLALILVFALWQPLGGVIWTVANPVGQVVLWALCALGWTLILVASFMINHFDLFGLRQVWLNLHGKECGGLAFVTPGPYRVIRHPIYLGFIVAFWATPTMTAAHLFFALLTTAYILIAVRFEERDLVTAHGARYREYRKLVPMLVPRFGNHRSSIDAGLQ
ncbi:MAG: isoprenylcysteine carboxylmethyltransferase family protein [Rhodocyclales bacterium]|nr:isoprenylcysteine carboxylmethyltransferase family protein [Rhodocyclales bacterium]MBI5784303.1 isoprenylcysteine carboxylmethyltransferase family protein [Rhodocyclales bacterium]